MRSTLKRWLSSESAPRSIVLLAWLLASPALTTGLTADDYFQKLVLTGKSDLAAIPRGPLAMFSWASGDVERARAMMEVGMTGWWTDPELVMSYFRPLSVVTHYLDYRLWPEAPLLMHAHSLLWFGAALLLLSSFYARVLGPKAPWLAGLALLLYAIDDAHGMALAWIANRNAVVAFALSLPVLLAYDRTVREQDRRATWLGPVALLLALLAGESALAVTGYLLAYALFLDPAPRGQALRRLVPYAAVSVLWAVSYRALGYGARGSGLVVDPGSEPLRYLVKALERVPVLLGAQLGFPPSDPWEAYVAIWPWLPALMYGLALLTLALFARAFWPLLVREPAARFFALGALCAALPVAAQFPHDRLLLFIGLGAMPLCAMLVGELLFGSGLSGLPRGVAIGAAVLHLGIAPLWLPLRVRAPLDSERMIGTAERSIDDSLAITSKTVIVVNPPVDAYTGYIMPMRAAQGRPRPRAVRWLATGASDVTLERLDERTLRVRPKDGFLSLPSEHMQRDPAKRMPVGQRVVFSDLTIEITALTRDGRPAEVLARFAYPLEDRRYLLLKFQGKAFVPFVPPVVGAQVTLPEVDFTELLP